MGSLGFNQPDVAVSVLVFKLVLGNNIYRHAGQWEWWSRTDLGTLMAQEVMVAHWSTA
jgi:hypothetical protein